MIFVLFCLFRFVCFVLRMYLYFLLSHETKQNSRNHKYYYNIINYDKVLCMVIFFGKTVVPEVSIFLGRERVSKKQFLKSRGRQGRAPLGMKNFVFRNTLPATILLTCDKILQTS